MNLVKMAADDWFVLALLGVWSIVALAVILERTYALWGLVPKSEDFRDKVLAAVAKGELASARAVCDVSRVPLARIFERGLAAYQASPGAVAEAVALRRTEVTQGFKRYLWLLGTVGSSAPFVGLFGTVVGIVRAFQSMAITGAGGFKVVSAGISAALIATAGGLLIAIYAVISYNYFVARVNQLSLAYRVFAQELVEALVLLPGKASSTPEPR
jgi:biopolymer transport protein ExbB